MTDSCFFYSRLQKIVRQHEHIKTELYVFLEVDYLAKLMELRKTHTGTFNAYVKQHIVFIDGNFIGDYKTLIQVATDSYGIEDAEVSNSVVLNRMMREETFRLMDETQHDVVFLQFANKTQSKDAMDYEFGTVYIEL